MGVRGRGDWRRLASLGALLLAARVFAGELTAPPLVAVPEPLLADAPVAPPLVKAEPVRTKGAATTPGARLVDRVAPQPVAPAARFGLGLLLGPIGIAIGTPLFAVGGAVVGLLAGTGGALLGFIGGAIGGAGIGAGFGVTVAQELLQGAPMDRDPAVVGGCLGSLAGALVSAMWLLAFPWPYNATPADMWLRLTPLALGALAGAFLGLDNGLEEASAAPAIAPTRDGQGASFVLAGRF